LIQKKIVDAFSVALLQEKIKPGMDVHIDIDDNQIVFRPSKKLKETISRDHQ
jgi:hypothetical protein